jgi:hypothetical protein
LPQKKGVGQKEGELMATEYIEIRPPMLDWLNEEAEAKGATLQEYVIHIILKYQAENEESDDDEEITDDSEDVEGEEE